MFNIILCYKDGRQESVQSETLGPYYPYSVNVLMKVVDKSAGGTLSFVNSGEIQSKDIHIFRELEDSSIKGEVVLTLEE